MKKKILVSLLPILILDFVYLVAAEQPAKVPRIGYVSGFGDPTNPGPQVEAFRQGLRDLGYIEGKNILVEYRYIEGKRNQISDLVTELVQLKVDALVTGTLPVILAAKQATKTIPIVMVTNVDPVATGLVDSFARPGGNITGLTRLTKDLNGKRLELFKEVVPGMSRVGVLWETEAIVASIGPVGVKEYEGAARAMKLEFQSLEVGGANLDLEGAFQAAAKAHVNALITVRTAVLNRYAKQIAELAIKNRLPSMHEGSEYVEAGCLVSYAATPAESFKRAAYYVDRILRKGVKPADLPVETPTKFELVINLKTARQIGLTIPDSVLYRVDRVIKEASAKAGGR
jgi:putative tryptophan/tyrosine transport system substrate-binding protein